jgi:hypothetical protein
LLKAKAGFRKKARRYVSCHEGQGSGYYMHKLYGYSSFVPFPSGNSVLIHQDYLPEKQIELVKVNNTRYFASHDSLCSAGPKSMLSRAC